MKQTNVFLKAVVLIAVTIPFICMAQEGRAATFTVNSSLDLQDDAPGDGNCRTAFVTRPCTLRAAITEANALPGDDIITLPAGIFQIALSGTDDNANAGGDFDITPGVTINGAGAGNTFIQAASAGTAFEAVLHFVQGGILDLGRTSTVSGVTIRNGFNGANIGERANVRLNSVTLSNNNRGGILLQGGNLTTNNSLITNNFWDRVGGAGLYITSGNATLNNTIISFNTIQSSVRAAAFGGGVRIDNGWLSLNNSSINNNTVTVTDPAASASGGGIAMLAGTVIFTDSQVTKNVAAATGGGASNGGGIDITNDSLVFTSLTLDRTYIGGNLAGVAGGIRRAGISMLEINQSAIINNEGTASGGGFFNIAASNDTNNILINNSTIAENKTNGFGGGIQNSPVSTFTSARINVNFTTIARNVANQDNAGTESGGGIFNSGLFAGINLKSSIVADNTVGTGGANPDISGSFTSQGYNHVENLGSANFVNTTGDATGTDPSLGALIANGSNSVFIPATNSPVIDGIPNGTNGCGAAPFNVDQRGAARPTDSNNDSDAACEKGSAEIFSPTAASVTVSGRVLTPKQRGIVGAIVYLTDSHGNTRIVRTNAFGYYRFDEVSAGETYLFNVFSKSYQFTPQVITVTEEITELYFIVEN